MVKNDFQYGGWNYYTLQCGTIMTLISPGNCTLQCGMWLWNRDSEFTKWQQPAMWQVALGWHTLSLLNTCHGSHSNVRRIGIVRLVSILTISLQLTCHSAPILKNLSKSDHTQQKKWRHVDFRDGESPLFRILGSNTWFFEKSMYHLL